MNKLHLLLAAFAAVTLAACGGNDSSYSGDLETDAEKFGYSIGVDLGRSLKPVATEVDIAALKAGLDDMLAGKTPLLDDKQRDEVKNAVAKKLQEKQTEERLSKGKEAKEKGDAFLAENAKKSGVKTTASGLQYEVVKEGSGETPKSTDKVTVHYTGTLINGDKFDSSRDRGQPVTFPLGNVIAGWTEGLQLMKPGAQYKLYIPSSLGYGERGAGAKIGPNEALIFDVELISVEKVAAAKAPAKKK